MGLKPSPEEALQQLSDDRYDHDAWNSLLTYLRPYLVTVAARHLSGNTDMAEDAVQNTSSRLYDHAPVDRLQALEAFKAYATTVCVNACRDLIKRRVPGNQGSDQSLEQLPGLPNSDSPDFSLISDEFLQRLRVHLSEGERRVLDLFLLGYKLSEIAEALGITYANAAVKLSRIRKSIDQRLR